MFRVSRYTRPSGRCPFSEFMEGLTRAGDKKTLAKIDAAVSQLTELGSSALVKVGLAEKMNDVWQLRPGQHRVFYFLDSKNQTYLLLNGFKKQKQNTPENELKRAEQLRQEYFATR